MIIAIHQPNYLPWLGYFSKIFAADVFVFHDRVEFSKSSYTKRCLILKQKGSQEKVWLSVPVSEHRTGTPIKEIMIDTSQGWTYKHLRKINNTYAAAPFFEQVFPFLSSGMEQALSIASLAEMNMFFIRKISDFLGIHTEFQRSSVLAVEGKADSLNGAIVKSLGGTAYIAGAGRKNYQQDDAFEGIRIISHEFGPWLAEHPYSQGTDAFTSGLSIVDALMYIGPEAIRSMFAAFHDTLTE